MASTRLPPLVLLAPVSGPVLPIERVPDPVFAQKLAGDGSIVLTEKVLNLFTEGTVRAATLDAVQEIAILDDAIRGDSQPMRCTWTAQKTAPKPSREMSQPPPTPPSTPGSP